MKTYTKEEEHFLLEKYPTNGGDFCANELKVSTKSIMTKVQRMGIKLTREKRGEIIRQHKPIKQNNEYSVNPEQFLDIKSIEVAYTLGLLWADGYILRRKNECRIELRVRSDDFEHFIKTLNKLGKWRVSHRHQKDRKPQSGATISNKPLLNFLIKNDYKAKSKSSACKILSTIPPHLRHYWFRGLFDGDGCMYHNPDGLHMKLSISSSYDQDWKYINDLFNYVLFDESFFIRRKVRKNGNKFSRIEVVKRSTILKFLNYIYKGYNEDKIGLPRKYEKYLTALQREKHCADKKHYINGDL